MNEYLFTVIWQSKPGHMHIRTNWYQPPTMSVWAHSSAVAQSIADSNLPKDTDGMSYFARLDHINISA